MAILFFNLEHCVCYWGILKQIIISNEKITKDNVITRGGIILMVFILVAFVIGVVLNVENWLAYTMPIVVHFAVAIFAEAGFAMKKDEEIVDERAKVDVLL